jgi:hypothetical protein
MKIIAILVSALLLANLPQVVGQKQKNDPLREERGLASSIGDVCVGGGGRFLIMHLPRDRTLAVFDTKAAKVVKYLPVADGGLKFAAGMDNLMTFLPGDNLLER